MYPFFACDQRDCVYMRSELILRSTWSGRAFILVDALYENCKNKSGVKVYHFIGKILHT